MVLGVIYIDPTDQSGNHPNTYDFQAGFQGLVGDFYPFFAENVVFISKMGGLKNGLRIALRLFYREIWPLLGFWVGKVGFRAVKRGFERSSGKLFSRSWGILFVFWQNCRKKEQKVTIMSQSSATFTTELSFSWPQANYKASARRAR